MAKVVIFVLGGNVQGVISDQKDVEVLLVDYDNEKDGDKRGGFQYVDCDPVLVSRSARGVEDDEELFAECD